MQLKQESKTLLTVSSVGVSLILTGCGENKQTQSRYCYESSATGAVGGAIRQSDNALCTIQKQLDELENQNSSQGGISPTSAFLLGAIIVVGIIFAKKYISTNK